MTTEVPDADFFGAPKSPEEIIGENLLSLNVIQRKVTTHLCDGKESLLFDFAIDPNTGKLMGIVDNAATRHRYVSEDYGIISLTFVFTYRDKKLFSEITRCVRLGSEYKHANDVIDGTVDTYNQKNKMK